MKTITHRVLLALFGIALLLCTAVAAIMARVPAAPVIVLESSHRKITAKPGETVRSTFQVTNRGNRPLHVGKIIASCGCIEAKIIPQVIEPGRSGSLTAVAITPPVDSKAIVLRIETNDPQRPESQLTILLGSTRTPPVAIFKPEAIALGFLDERQTTSFTIETLEKPGTTQWLHTVTTSDRYISARLDVSTIHERDIDNVDVLRRVYRCRVSVDHIPPIGHYAGDLLFHTRAASNDPILRIPLNGAVRPAVYATPSTIYANIIGDQPIVFSVLISSSDRLHKLSTAVVSAPNNIIVWRDGELDGQCMFKGVINKRQIQDGPSPQCVSFSTNHPECPRLEVPVLLTTGTP